MKTQAIEKINNPRFPGQLIRDHGGLLQIIGHEICHCGKDKREIRKVLKPNLKSRKKGFYYETTYWCPDCGIFEYNILTKIII